MKIVYHIIINSKLVKNSYKITNSQYNNTNYNVKHHLYISFLNTSSKYYSINKTVRRMCTKLKII